MREFLAAYLLLACMVSVHAQNQYYRNWTVVNAEKKERIALIIANNTYESAGSLEQPIPMASKLERKLQDEGFDVLVGHDLNRMRMISVLDDFSNKFRNYEFAMIFYLGHGFQIDGENYLIPVDAQPSSKDDVEVHAINVDYVLKKVNDPQTPKVIVLDACRNNPFAVNWSSADRSGSNSGFGDVSAPRNAEIFFTTAKGAVVRDDNPYIEYFIQELKQGACLSDIKRVVSKRIFEYNADQIPASYGQLFDKVCFGEAPVPDPVVVVNTDSDGDGIIDREDDCPYEFGVASRNGCPEPQITITEAEQWYRKGEEIHDKGGGENYREAYKWFEKAANEGHRGAQLYAGWMHHKSQGVEQDWRKAIYWYTKAAEQGSLSSQMYLGEIYRDGSWSDLEDFELAKFWFEKASAGGDVQATVNLGELYEYGWITERDSFQIKYGHAGEPDLEKARAIYQQVYDDGHLIGKHYLGRSYDVKSYDPTHKYRDYPKSRPYDVSKAIEIYMEAGNEGHVPSMYRIYELYCLKANKDWVNQSKYTKEIGIEWLTKAAETDNGFYANELGKNYLYGFNGVKKDKYKGQRLIQEACDKGYWRACD